MAKFWKGLMQFAFIIICVGALVGILFGHPIKLPKGFDSDSYACGVDAGVGDYPYTYFVNPTPEYKHRTVCVKTCPNADTQLLDCVPNRVVQDCKKQMNVLKPEEVVLYYESFGYMGNICVPTSLQYYAGIQDLIVPSMFKRIVNDFIQSWPLIIIVSLLIIPVCSSMLRELKNNTTYLVWIFTLITILLTGFLGAHFVQQWNFARNYEASQAVINNFKVSAQYIYEMSNKPNEMVNFVLAIVFLCAFLYGVNWVYKKTEVVQDLADIFEYVEKFMKNYGALDDLSLYFIAMLFILFSLVIISTIFLGSAFYVDRETPHTGPFEKTQLNIAFSFSTILILFLGFWIIQIINGAYQNIIFGGFRDWIHSETNEFNQNNQNNQINQSAVNLANQGGPQNNENKAKINLKLIYQNLNHNLICQISFMLFLSPIKFTLDYIKDSLQSLLKCKANPFKSLAVLEEVLYFEVQTTTQNIKEPIEALRSSLNIDKDGNEVNAFEIVRNINDFFLIIVKLFTFLICGTMFLSLYTTLTVLGNHVPSLQPLIKMNIYQPLIPAVISGIIGYFISQIYFCQYSVVSCFGYFYLSLYTKNQQSFQQFQQQNQGQFRNNEGGLIQAYERNSQVSKQLKRMNDQFPELEKMMQRALADDENNQN